MSGADHPARETLHAFAAGEVDPAQRAALAAHLESCAECSANLEQVEAMRGLFDQMAPRSFDDLRWQRLARRVQGELEERAASDLRRTPRRRGWAVAIGIAGVAALVMWVVIGTAPDRRPLHRGLTGLDGATVIAGDQPFRFALSGASMRLAEGGRLRVTRASGHELSLELLEGELGVEAPYDAAPPQIVVQTPEFSLIAHSRAFIIGLVSERAYVQIDEGEARLERAGDAPELLRGGDRRELERRRAAASPSEPVAVPLGKVELAEEPLEREAKAGPPAVALRHALPRDRAARPKLPSRDGPLSAAQPLAAEADTRVEVTAPEADPIAERWAAANLAYERGDLEESAAIAGEVASAGKDRVEGRLARELLCEAELALGRPEVAVASCEAVVSLEPSEGEAQLIHQRIATIYRAQLGDCSRAIRHYDQVIVFGRESLLDEEALLGRIDCALSLGRLTEAERDLALLAGRSRPLVHSVDFADLKTRFEAARAGGIRR